jgi:hypothetical protein
MRTMNRLFTRLLNFASRRRDEERLHEEMQEHVAAQAEENLRAGMTPEEARRQACLKLGAMEAVREEYQTEKSLPLLEHLLCAAEDRDLARRVGGSAVPGKDGNRGSGRDGLTGGDAGGDGHFRNGGLQREPADEGAGHPRGLGRAQDASIDRGGWAAHGGSWDRIGGGAAGWRLCQQLVGADCVPGESAASRGARRRSADDGTHRRGSVGHSRPASAGC